MAAPDLDTYEYQFKDNGVVLNGPLAFDDAWVDIEKVTGLDMPDVISNSTDLDGMHGGFISAAFVGPRTVVLEGTVYAPPDQIDEFLDSVITNYLPSNTEFPFHYRQSGRQFYIMAKSLGVKFDVDNLRGSGRSPIQIQLICENPIKRVDNPDLTISSVGVGQSLSNHGNVETWPIITAVGPFTQLRIDNTTQGKILNLSHDVPSGAPVVIDTRYRSVRLSGAQIAGSITTPNGWFTLQPGVNTIAKGAQADGTPVVTVRSYSGWL